MIVAFLSPPPTPTAPADASPAEGDFASALVRSEGSQDGAAVPTEVAERTESDTQAGVESMATPLLDPLATSNTATLSSWMQLVTGRPEASSPENTGTLSDPGHTGDLSGGQPGGVDDAVAAEPAWGPASSVKSLPSAASVETTGTVADDAQATVDTVTPEATNPTTASSTTRSAGMASGVDTSLNQDPTTPDDGEVEPDRPADDTRLDTPRTVIGKPGTVVVGESALGDEGHTVNADTVGGDTISPTVAEQSSDSDPTSPEPSTEVQAARHLEVPDAVDIADNPTPEIGPMSQPAPANQGTRPMIDSGTLQRVEAALEQLENTPPPRHLVLDIGEDGGVRIRLSSTNEGVQVDVQSNDGRERDTAWEQDLRQRLAERGFDLNDEKRQDRNDGTDAEATTSPPVRPNHDDHAVRL